MTPEERRQMDRNLDRIERMLHRCDDADRQLRKKRRAQWRAQRDKLQGLWNRGDQDKKEDDPNVEPE